MKIAHIFISGFVQGIGFRYFIRKNALELGLKGWVRNILDGRVEAVFQSSASFDKTQDKSSDQEAKEKIEEMIALCRKGPFLAEVENVDVEWEEVEREFEGFEINT